MMQMCRQKIAACAVVGRWIGLLALCVSLNAAPVANEQILFDGKTLAGWKQSGFEGEGAVKVENPFRNGPGAIVLEQGTTLSGVTWIKGSALPRTNYEITLE